MEEKYAVQLVGELAKHPAIYKPIEIDEGRLLKILESENIPENSSRFHEDLSSEFKQLYYEYGCDERYFSISVRRILRNRNVRNYRLSLPKKMWESLVSEFGIYDSDGLTRKIRGNQNLVNLIGECKIPFSLLGKFETYDLTSGTEKTKKRPLLIIPGISEDERKIVEAFEERNII